MNMTSTLPKNLANGAPKMSQNQKNHVKVGQKSRWCSSFSSITVVWFTINSFQRVKRSIRTTAWPFWDVYVKQFVVNGWICGQTTHRFFSTIMRLHIPAWLWMNFWLNMKQKSLLSHRFRRPRAIRSVWKIGLTVGMLVLAQKEPILKAIMNICIKIHKNVVFSTSPSQIWSNDIISNMPGNDISKEKEIFWNELQQAFRGTSLVHLEPNSGSFFSRTQLLLNLLQCILESFFSMQSANYSKPSILFLKLNPWIIEFILNFEVSKLLYNFNTLI